jgi:hypothetical protein
MSTRFLPLDSRFANHLDAAATVVRIGVGYVPAALKLLVIDARAGRLTGDRHATLNRMDAIWAFVENAWDRVLPVDRADLFYEIWSDRFAQAATVLEV